MWPSQLVWLQPEKHGELIQTEMDSLLEMEAMLAPQVRNPRIKVEEAEFQIDLLCLLTQDEKGLICASFHFNDSLEQSPSAHFSTNLPVFSLRNLSDCLHYAWNPLARCELCWKQLPTSWWCSCSSRPSSSDCHLKRMVMARSWTKTLPWMSSIRKVAIKHNYQLKTLTLLTITSFKKLNKSFSFKRNFHYFLIYHV